MSSKQDSPISSSLRSSSADPSSRSTILGPDVKDSTPAPEARSRQRQAQLDQLENDWDTLTSAVQDLVTAGARAPKHERHSEYLAVRSERTLVAEELAELRALLSSPPRSREMESGPSNAAPAPAATRPAQLRYKEYPVQDSRFPRLDKTVLDFSRWFARLQSFFDTCVPAYPPVESDPDQTRLRAVVQALGTDTLVDNYSKWLVGNLSTATWEDAGRFLQSLLPWRDTRAEQLSAVLHYAQQSVEDTSATDFVVGFLNVLALAGLDTTSPSSAAFLHQYATDEESSRGGRGDSKESLSLHPAFEGLDSLLCQILQSKLNPALRAEYLRKRRDEATSHFKAEGTYLRESLASMVQTVNSLTLTEGAFHPAWKVQGQGGKVGGGVHGHQQGNSGGQQGGGGEGAQNKSGSPNKFTHSAAPSGRTRNCFHCQSPKHLAMNCPQLSLSKDAYKRLQPLGEARQALRQSTTQLKGTVKLHAIQLAPAYQTAAKATLSAQSAELRRLDKEYAELLASCAPSGSQ
jgi:hypothetical protein